ncbi:hypothetical protein SBOR_8974 [Sclerotinia borealis F-4128]|uniref:BTB domain-containing protein n=1 Tax=Sclerotinia borealis (strain F-4128) TaxID=1432307 RepID=W9C7S4_SCLBF|nr:hypothetical protein SBOR_8974 [Sclerotinia borealis F-4128]
MDTLITKFRRGGPFLDFTRDDESIIIKVGIEPNNAEFKVSKLRLDYYSPYFRGYLASKMKEDLSRVVELQEVCPKIFGHIVQYMNTESILIPGPPQTPELQALALQDPPTLKTILETPERRRSSVKS